MGRELARSLASQRLLSDFLGQQALCCCLQAQEQLGVCILQVDQTLSSVFVCSFSGLDSKREQKNVCTTHRTCAFDNNNNMTFDCRAVFAGASHATTTCSMICALTVSRCTLLLSPTYYRAIGEIILLLVVQQRVWCDVYVVLNEAHVLLLFCT